MKFIDVTKQFATEDACLDYLERMRWRNGLCCIECGSVRVERLQLNTRPRKNKPASVKSRKRAAQRAVSRRVYQCLEQPCKAQFTATSGTIFHKTHLPLNTWFMAIALVCEAKKGMSANQLKRHLGVNYRTAWYLCHRIREAMIELAPKQLSGDVELDETYIGGKKARKTGYLRNKRMILGAVERGGDLRMRYESCVKQASKQVAREWVNEVVAPDVKRVFTDSHPAYIGLNEKFQHESVNHIADEWVRGDVHTNHIESAWSLLKRAIVGTYHKVSIKHLQRYLDEFTYRFNRRDHQDKMFAETVRELLSRIQLPYAKLTAASPVSES